MHVYKQLKSENLGMKNKKCCDVDNETFNYIHVKCKHNLPIKRKYNRPRPLERKSQMS